MQLNSYLSYFESNERNSWTEESSLDMFNMRYVFSIWSSSHDKVTVVHWSSSTLDHHRAIRLQSFIDSAFKWSLESVFLKGFQLLRLLVDDSVELLMDPCSAELLMDVWRLELFMEPYLLLRVLLLLLLLLTPLLELVVEWLERSFRLLHCTAI